LLRKVYVFLPLTASAGFVPFGPLWLFFEIRFSGVAFQYISLFLKKSLLPLQLKVALATMLDV
jgi:hypothetical protein